MHKRNRLRPPDEGFATGKIVRLLSKEELAEYVGCSTRYIENEVNDGRLRAVKFARRLVRYRPADIECWLEGRLTEASTETEGG